MRRLLGLTLPLLLLAPGCVKPRPAEVPMRTLEIRPAAAGSRDLIVLLPGRRDRPEDFAKAGFGELAAGAGVRARMVAVDAHLGNYFGRTVVRVFTVPGRHGWKAWRAVWEAFLASGALEGF